MPYSDVARQQDQNAIGHRVDEGRALLDRAYRAAMDVRMRICGHRAQPVGQRGARRRGTWQMINKRGIAAEDHAHGGLLGAADEMPIIAVIASEAKQSNSCHEAKEWIASSHPPSPEGGLRRTRVLLAMTVMDVDRRHDENEQIAWLIHLSTSS